MAGGPIPAALGSESVLSKQGAIHLDRLPEPQRAALLRLGVGARERDFYLAGGTALALQLGHRRSVDLDWFREEGISDPLELGSELGVEVRATAPNTLHAECLGVATSFFAYRYPLLRPRVRVEACDLASIQDIAAMKLTAIAQRGARKDFFDVAAIGEAGLPLAKMLEAYQQKFSVSDITHVLASLNWFDDADSDPDPVLNAGMEWDQVKETIRGWVRGFANG